MGLKFDKFTWTVIGVVVLLLVAAVVTVNLNRGQESSTPVYLTDDSPITPVHNAFLALQKADITTARAQYSTRVLKNIETNQAYSPFNNSSYINHETARRLRIIKSEISANDPNRGTVVMVIDSYSSGGLFGGSNTYSSERVVEVVREANHWKIDSPEFFDY
ncbi:MAG: hypothetical protein NT075_17955 [Chloroflexi bacterium]|nr:hypothetical protein [Chloroflexota bacterium]